MLLKALDVWGMTHRGGQIGGAWLKLDYLNPSSVVI
jgi:hypothetical protein